MARLKLSARKVFMVMSCSCNTEVAKIAGNVGFREKKPHVIRTLCIPVALPQVSGEPLKGHPFKVTY